MMYEHENCAAVTVIRDRLVQRTSQVRMYATRLLSTANLSRAHYTYFTCNFRGLCAEFHRMTRVWSFIFFHCIYIPFPFVKGNLL